MQISFVYYKSSSSFLKMFFAYNSEIFTNIDLLLKFSICWRRYDYEGSEPVRSTVVFEY